MQFKLHFKCKLKIQNHRWPHQHQSVRCEKRKVPKHLHRLVPDPAITHRVRSLNHFSTFTVLFFTIHRIHYSIAIPEWQCDFLKIEIIPNIYISFLSYPSNRSWAHAYYHFKIAAHAKTDYDYMQNTVRRRFIDARLIEFYAKIVPYTFRHWQ